MAKRNPVPNPVLKLGFITFSTIERPEIDVTVRLAKDTPKLTGGYGGWEIVTRPRRRGTLEWVGVEPYEVTIDLLFDVWGYPRTDPSTWIGPNALDQIAERLTHDVRDMDQLARPVATGLPSPTIKVTGKVVPIDPAMVWVISGIKWGDAIFNTEGFILRQECTVSLLQADGGEHANVIGPVKGSQPGKSKVPMFHIWKKGNTFELISIRYYKTDAYKTKIMKLNHIRDWKKVKVGQKIKLPRP